jgi:hypothetical protein
VTLFGAEDGATFSPDGAYRYTLTRWWNPDSPQIAWIMLNPSTANGSENDPTLRRVIDFSKRWGYGGLVVVNLFALVATDPEILATHPDPIGPANDAALFGATGGLTAVAAWGASVPAKWRHRPRAIRLQLAQRRTPLYHLGLTKDGHPRHPLYLPATTAPTLWTEP